MANTTTNTTSSMSQEIHPLSPIIKLSLICVIRDTYPTCPLIKAFVCTRQHKCLSFLRHPSVSWQSWNFTTILHCPGPVAHLLIHQHLNNFISKLLWHFTRKSSTSLIWTTFKFPDNQLGQCKYENMSSEMSTTLTLPHLARNIAFIQTCETPPGRRYMK